MSVNPTSPRQWRRFGLAALVVLSLSIVAIFAGYRSGYQHGYNFGQLTPTADPQVTETYSLAEIVLPDVSAEERTNEFNSVKDLIQSTIRTEVWDPVIGNDVVDDPASQSMIITAPQSVHPEIRELLAQLERLAEPEAATALLPSLQALASAGKTRDYAMPGSTPVDSPIGRSRADSFAKKYFAATVAGVSQHWGAPRYHGEKRDADFPQWSLDQKIATWPRGQGLSYVALRIADDGVLRVVVGWRANS